jgi:hypothetical protein
MIHEDGEIEAKFEQIIDDYRENHSEDFEDIYWGLNKPCQIEIFSMFNPIKFSLLFLSHDEKRNDKQIIIHQTENGSDFIDNLEEKLEAPRWRQVVEDEIVHSTVDQATKTQFEVSTRGDLLINSFQNHLMDNGSNHLFSDQFGTKSAYQLGEEMWCYFIYGDIIECDTEDIFMFSLLGSIGEDDGNGETEQQDQDESEDNVDSDSDSAESNNETESSHNESIPEKRQMGVYGTFFYEPVWVGDIPDPDFRDRILGQMSYDRDTVMKSEFDNSTVRVTQDGLVIADNVSDKNEALEIINTVFGASIFHGYTFQAATQNDLVEVEIEDGEISNILGSPDLPRKISNISQNTQYKVHHSTDYHEERKIIDIAEMESILDYAQTIHSEEKLGERTHLALQAYTHYQNGEYTQAFLLSWISVEQHINSYVYDHLTNSINISNNRANDIINSSNWSASNKIEILEIANGINKNRYDEINEFRKKRNRVVHDMESVSESFAKRILSLTFSLLRNNVDDDRINNKWSLFE